MNIVQKILLCFTHEGSLEKLLEFNAVIVGTASYGEPLAARRGAAHQLACHGRISDKRQAAGAKHRSTERISSDDYSDHRYIEQGWDVLAWLLLDCRGVTSSLPKGVV